MRVRTSISIPEELQERVERYADETKRTVSAVCELALEQFFGAVQLVDSPIKGENDERAKGQAISA